MRIKAGFTSPARTCYVCAEPCKVGRKDYTWDTQSRYVHLLCVPGANGDAATGYVIASNLSPRTPEQMESLRAHLAKG